MIENIGPYPPGALFLHDPTGHPCKLLAKYPGHPESFFAGKLVVELLDLETGREIQLVDDLAALSEWRGLDVEERKLYPVDLHLLMGLCEDLPVFDGEYGPDAGQEHSLRRLEAAGYLEDTRDSVAPTSFGKAEALRLWAKLEP